MALQRSETTTAPPWAARAARSLAVVFDAALAGAFDRLQAVASYDEAADADRAARSAAALIRVAAVAADLRRDFEKDAAAYADDAEAAADDAGDLDREAVRVAERFERAIAALDSAGPDYDRLNPAGSSPAGSNRAGSSREDLDADGSAAFGETVCAGGRS